MSTQDGVVADHYRTLGVSPEAGQDEIKYAFRTLAKRHHPDSATRAPGAGGRFSDIANAYAVLSDPDARARYDAARGTPSATPSRRGGVAVDARGSVGWYRDPYELHDYRWFSGGEPTSLVRDAGATSYDPPPSRSFVGVLEAAPDVPVAYETVRAGDGVDPEGSLGSTRRRRGRREIPRERVGLLLLALLVVGLSLVLRWPSGSRTVTATGPSVDTPVLTGQTYYLDTGIAPTAGSGLGSSRATVESIDVGAELWTMDGDVTHVEQVPVSAVVCERRPGTAAVGAALAQDLAASCSGVHPLPLPGRVDLGSADVQVLYAVTITTAGTYRNFRLEVGYDRGGSAGTVSATSTYVLVAGG